MVVSRISSGIRTDPVHGIPPPSGVEGLPEHAAFDVPGTRPVGSLQLFFGRVAFTRYDASLRYFYRV